MRHCYDPALAGTKAKVNSAGPCGTFTHVSVDTAANGEGTTDCAYECSETPL